MKRFSMIIITVALAIVVGLLAACGKKSGGGFSNTTNTNTTNGCPTGTVASNNGCVYSNTTGSIGFYTQTSNSPVYQNNGSVFTVGSGYKDFLKTAMGTCDRDHSNGGLSDCDSWANGFNDMVIQMQGTAAKEAIVTFRSYPYSNNAYSSYSYSLPSVKEFFLSMFRFQMGNQSYVYNPMTLKMTIWPINDNQGFELRGYGPQGSYAYNKLIQVQINSGKFEDTAFNFSVAFNGGTASTGTMVRCQTVQCGL